MNLVIAILICIGLILSGALHGKPVGYIIIALAFIALLLATLGGFGVHVGR